MTGAELVLDARNATGESPVWRAQEAALYWADIPRGLLQCWQPGQGAATQWQLPQMLACMAGWQG
ncbi:MAG: SMP-30/gluconolactonase/LRE family protein, partial [Comamonas sp.]